MSTDWIFAAGMVLTATLVALGCLILLAAFQSRRAPVTDSLFQQSDQATVFVFDGEAMIDATPSARFMLASSVVRGGPWLRLLARLGPMFPELEARVLTLHGDGQFILPSKEGLLPPLVLRGEYVGGLIRLTLINTDTEQREPGRDSAADSALQQEVSALRNVLSNAPILVWTEALSGDVVWANQAYLMRAADLLPTGTDLSWPLPRIFNTAAIAPGGKPQRQKLALEGGPQWFDLVVVPAGDQRLAYALPSNAAVRAEGSLRDFMQTLTKTFAHLPIGLAIFDKDRVLQLFNPALVDLTTLPPDFLISRPSLNGVLDALRDRAMIPEPKDYRTWRKQMIKLEEDASSGLYEETWSLPGGQTFRVIGRPHPNGALAFMFEDISSEMSRTRRYRADLELGQAVIDAVDEAVAVFSQGGQLVMSNFAYAQLWDHDPAVLLSDAGIGSLSDWWRDHSAASLIWADAMDFVITAGDRTAWEGEARLLDGRLISCRFRPITGGATLITFHVQAAGLALTLQPEEPGLMSA
ncbi:PAS-domain containing protein [Tabrizicola sp.]|uniref:PAS-domain containing protein n=1 Tax=Tabrizicola sp. TaxID=2005166 RepID=UPI00286CC0CA|nr:PAS-domain containing protein [Tabrizicola sp.]